MLKNLFAIFATQKAARSLNGPGGFLRRACRGRSLGAVASAAGAFFLAAVRAADLYLVQSAVAAVVVVLAHVHVAGYAEVDVFHNYLRAARFRAVLLLLPARTPFMRAGVDKMSAMG